MSRVYSLLFWPMGFMAASGLEEGAVKWNQEGLPTPEKVKVATRKYAAEMDGVKAFVEESGLVGVAHNIRANQLIEK